MTQIFVRKVSLVNQAKLTLSKAQEKFLSGNI